jgi:hypothetical protein
MKPNDDVRSTELERVNAEVGDRLRGRGILLTGRESGEELADLLEAVERFEGLVEARGGDLMVDDLTSPEPDDPHFVLPEREPGESVPAYIDRIVVASDQIRRHPSID